MTTRLPPSPEQGPSRKWLIGGIIVLLVIGSAAAVTATFWSSLFPGRLVHSNCSNLEPSSIPSTPGNHTLQLYCSGTNKAGTVSLTPAGRSYPPTKTVPTFALPAGYLNLTLVPYITSECVSSSGSDKPLKSGDPVILSGTPTWYYCASVNADILGEASPRIFAIAWSLGEWGIPASSTGFRMAADPLSITIMTGSSGTVRITVTSFGGHNDTVQLTGDVNPDEENAPTVLLDPNSITLAADGSNSTELTIFASANTPVKAYYVTVLGDGEGYLSSTLPIEIIVRTN